MDYFNEKLQKFLSYEKTTEAEDKQICSHPPPTLEDAAEKTKEWLYKAMHRVEPDRTLPIISVESETIEQAPKNKPPSKKSKDNKRFSKHQKTHFGEMLSGSLAFLETNTQKVLDYEKKFRRIMSLLAYAHSASEVFDDFVVMFACSMSNALDKANYSKREDMYLNCRKKYNDEEWALFLELAAYTIAALEENQEQDFLGEVFSKLNLCSKARRQAFTPYHICRLMSSITIGDGCIEKIKQDGYCSVADPCCGSGAMLIAGINEIRRKIKSEGCNFQECVLAIGQDIDTTVAMMCYIQLSLLGVAGYIKIGNALTHPLHFGDSLNDYWFTPMYFSDIWYTRRKIRGSDPLT